jgi:hypothetical protein
MEISFYIQDEPLVHMIAKQYDLKEEPPHVVFRRTGLHRQPPKTATGGAAPDGDVLHRLGAVGAFDAAARRIRAFQSRCELKPQKAPRKDLKCTSVLNAICYENRRSDK